jgi:hypothetical protein
MERKNWLRGIAAAAALISGIAHAGTVTDPSLGGSVVISDGSTIDNTWTFSSSYVPNGDGTFTYVGSNNPASTLWGFSWDITVNPDPFINSTLTVVNKTASTKSFDILFTLPVGAGFTPAYKNGSMGITFTDFNGNGSPADGNVALTNINWTGRIDGVDALSLYAFDGSCGPGSPGCTVNLGTVSDGPLLHPAGVASSIGIHLAFDLTAGDKVTFTNHFEVTPVPLPAAAWLFGSGLLGLGALARRKRST